MKVVLQSFEPQHMPVGSTSKLAATAARKPVLRLTPAVSETRLFHAWRA